MIDYRKCYRVTITTVGDAINSQHSQHAPLYLIIVPEKAGEFVREVHIYMLFFSDHSPIRSRLRVPSLPINCLVYISSEWICSHSSMVSSTRDYDPHRLESHLDNAYTEKYEAEISWVLSMCAVIRTCRQQIGKYDCGFLSYKACTTKCMFRRLRRYFGHTIILL